MDKPICFLDIESTSPDPVTGKIIELAMIAVESPVMMTTRVQRFNPGRPIPAEASAVHKIYDADVADMPKFTVDSVMPFIELMKGCDLCGYNLRRFDLVILDEELRRLCMRLDLKDVRVIDCFGIFAKKEPRTLSDAVLRYVGREHEGAHGALADAQATLDVLYGQLKAYPDLAAMSQADLATFSRMGEFEFVDLACKLYRDKDGDVRYAFGKVKDMRIRDDRGFANWMLGKDFSGSTKDAILDEFNRLDGSGGLFDESHLRTGKGGVPF